MECIVSMVVLLGLGYGCLRGGKWLRQAGRAQTGGEDRLTPNDLKALEEAAKRLIEDLNAAADECVSRVEQVCTRALQTRNSLEQTKPYPLAPQECGNVPANASVCRELAVESICQMINGGRSPAEVAKLAGLTTGEVELMHRMEQATEQEDHQSAFTWVV